MSAPAAASDDLGDVSFAGNGTASTFECPSSCTVNFGTTVSTGSFAGVNGSPFTLAWATPSASMVLNLTAICGTGLGFAEISSLSTVTIQISGAELVYGGAPSSASVTVTFSLSQPPGATELVANGLQVSVQGSTGVSFSFTPFLGPQGILLFTPEGPNGLCPNGTGPTMVNLSGTIWSVM